MQRIQKILVSVGLISVFVGLISIAARQIIKPTKLVSPSQPAQNIPDVSFPDQTTIAVWSWDYPTKLKDQIPNILRTLKTADINTFYLSVDEYIDIYEMPESNQRDEKLNNYQAALRDFISQAKSQGIQVHALAGHTAYSYDSHEYIPPIILQHVFDFNQNNPQTPFSGIQFDIEFYEDPRFENDISEYTQSYLRLLNTLVKQTLAANQKYSQSLPLGFAIPHWFGKPSDYFNQPILPDIIKALTPLPNPYLVVMAYRNQIEGDSGVLSVVEDELSQTTNTPIKIIVGQELVENTDPKLSHFGRSYPQIKVDLLKIIESSKKYPSFQGVSVNDLKALTKLLN